VETVTDLRNLPKSIVNTNCFILCWKMASRWLLNSSVTVVCSFHVVGRMNGPRTFPVTGGVGQVDPYPDAVNVGGKVSKSAASVAELAKETGSSASGMGGNGNRLGSGSGIGMTPYAV
jgi:hypothetical protein